MSRHPRWLCFGFLIVIVSVWAETSAPAANQCAERRVRSPAVEDIAYAILADDVLFQGHTKHAARTGEGRPVPDLKTIDYKRAWVKFRLAKLEWRDINALFFTFHVREEPSKDPEVINLPFDFYWCLAAMGDMVLLSDRFMDHYTKVAAIDHQAETIDLIDRWPNLFSDFMGVTPQFVTAPSGSGRLSGRALMRFSRSDFKRLFRAAITVDTPQLVDLLKRTLPPEAATPELGIALGRSLLYAGNDKTFAALAASLLLPSTRLAADAGKRDIVEATAPVAFTAIALAYWFAVAAGNDKAAAIWPPRQADLLARYGPQMDRIDAQDALRIALAALRVHPQTALVFLRQAIAKDPSGYRAFVARATLLERSLEHKVVPGAPNRDELMAIVKQAGTDAETALTLIDAREREFEHRRRDRAEKRGDYWVKGITAQQVDGAELDEMKDVRRDAVALRDRLGIAQALIEAVTAPAGAKP